MSRVTIRVVATFLSSLTPLVATAAIEVAPAIWLELQLTSGKTEFRKDEQIKIRVRLVNRGRNPVYFYPEFTWDYRGTMDAKLDGDDGSEMLMPIIVEDWPPGDRRIDYSRLVRLEPEDKIETIEWLPLSDLELVPGEYVLKMVYESPVALGVYKDTPVWNKEAGPLLGSFRFTVVD